jgi:hypothetical protein
VKKKENKGREKKRMGKEKVNGDDRGEYEEDNKRGGKRVTEEVRGRDQKRIAGGGP